MDRKQKRLERRQQRAAAKAASNTVPSEQDEDANYAGTNISHSGASATAQQSTSDVKFAKLLSQNEDVLLNFVANINKLYQEKLGRPAPFMTFVICGMQSAGKSTIMERFMQAPLNIIQEGTGTRCPLDTTCIHDGSLNEPKCELSGKELDPAMSGTSLTTDEVFRAITAHNKMLADKDEFSTQSLRLIYRAKNVQNMRFVDTPGIISNKGTGQDNREDIKRILRDTMKKPNAKLCVLVEPKEFSTNPIIDFCDETFGGRPKWTNNSIVLMTKFDKQLEDARSGSKANKFFKEFHDNNLYPHLIITPTLPKEDLPADKLLIERRKLLQDAHGNEMERFEDWRLGHERFRETCPEDELLHPEIQNKIGFSVAKDKMREMMLTDTAQRLPEVLKSLRNELSDCHNDLEYLIGKKKLMDPREVKIIVGQVLHEVAKRVNSYLDGDLETASKFPDVLRDLEEELEEEEESEWCLRRLGTCATLDDEEEWRTLIDSLLDQRKIPSYVYPEKKFLGGKQFQRAGHLMKVVMAEAMPDPSHLKEYVPSGAGYLQGGLQRENWERATLAIVKMSSKKISHPGINFFIKHVGSIFRRLFLVGIHDLKQGSADVSIKFKLLPDGIESHLVTKFDNMVWNLMENAANKTHVSLEPMYSTLDPSLPTFHPIEDDVSQKDKYMMNINGQYERLPTKKEIRDEGFMNMVKSRIESLLSVDGGKAKDLLRSEGKKKATEKKSFLPEERTAMINNAETDAIILSAFRYTMALHDQIMIYLNFQINHYLYEEYKEKISTFSRDVLDEDWSAMIPVDGTLDDEIKKLEDNIADLQASLQDVQRLQAQF